jgi:hypothetical protein
MLSVTNKPFTLSDVLLHVIMLNVVALSKMTPQGHIHQKSFAFKYLTPFCGRFHKHFTIVPHSPSNIRWAIHFIILSCRVILLQL